MRFPIRFRLWSEGSKKFVFPGFICSDDATHITVNECAKDGYQLSACTEMPDKNGRLIWTGDIVQNPRTLNIVTVCDSPEEWLSATWSCNYEVIGNKWEGKQ